MPLGDDVLTAPPNCPLRIGTPGEFAQARTFLAKAGYRDASLCHALDIPDISDLIRVDWERTPLDALSPELRLILNLFVRTHPSPEAEVTAVWGADTAAAFLSLGLLRRSQRHAGHVVATVFLSPIGDFVVASDLSRDPDGGELAPYDDIVFRPLHRLTLQYLRFLPDLRQGEALDLCGGCGIGALHLARTARVAVTADLTPRSAFFAAFNGRLNESPMVSRCGDLYAPVEGEQFDLIAAHPPYVPDIGSTTVYRDGGEAGETIVRRMVEGLARHLRPGGTCVIFCLARDTNARPFEQRVRDWLGEAAQEFDIVFGADETRSIAQVVESQRHWVKGDANAALRRLDQRLRDLDTLQFVYGALFVRRHPASIGSQPLRLQITANASATDFDRVLAWRARRGQPDFRKFLAGVCPVLAPHLELHTRHVVKDSQLAVSEMLFRVSREFESALQPELWLVPVIAKLNGRQSVAEVYNAAQAAGELPEGFPLEPFIELVDLMVERGFLLIDPSN